MLQRGLLLFMPIQSKENMMHVVVSTFSEMGHAETAVAALQKAGFDHDEIGVLMRGYLVREQMGAADADEALSGAGIGALAGTAVGSFFGLLAGAASITVPGVGLVLAGGVVAATLGGAAAGAVYGTLLGIVIKLGLTDEDARFYTDTLANDGVVVLVKARGERAAKAWRILHEAKATRTHTTILGRSQNTADSMPVIGLFPNPENASETMTELVDEGIDQEKIHLLDGRVVRQSGLPGGHYPTMYVPTPFGLSPMPLLPPASESLQHNAAEAYLTRLGIDAADAPFYLDAVRQGGALLIVETQDKQEAHISRTVMKAMDVTQMTAPS